MNTTDHTPRTSRVRRIRQLAASVTVILLAAVGLASPAQAIYRGSTSNPGSYASTVLLIVTFPTRQLPCTGSLIASNVVITAAHCVRDKQGKAPLYIHAMFNYGISADTYTIQASSSSSAPGYNAATYTGDDIAVVRLKTNAHSPVMPISRTDPGLGAQIVIAGYGCQGDPYTGGFPCDVTQLRHMTSVVVRTGICPSATRPWRLCDHSYPSATDNGDSGAPVTVVRNGVRTLVGVHNGLEARGTTPSSLYNMYFTSAAQNLAWIRSVTGIR